MKDLKGHFVLRLTRGQDLLTCWASALSARLQASWWGVEFGSGCIFHGRTRLRRSPGSAITVGNDCRFRSRVGSNAVGLNRPCMLSTLRSGATLKIGSACGFSGTVIAAAESIIIGDRVMCGGNATITDTDWHGLQPSERSRPGACAPIVIEEDVFIGLNALVLKGVTIGRGTVVAAGSVVTRSLPEMVVAAGNPAQVIRQL